MKKAIAISIMLLFACSSLMLHANDSAASTALGGIQLRNERRISMVKEKLFISIDKIRVEYEFLNESDHDITTEVAFPLPPYEVTFTAGGIRYFDDFGVEVEGTELKYQVEAKAKLNGRDFTQILQRFNVDVATLGHYDETSADEPFSADFRKLTISQKQTLVDAGLFDADSQHPLWAVEKIYHWTPDLSLPSNSPRET